MCVFFKNGTFLSWRMTVSGVRSSPCVLSVQMTIYGVPHPELKKARSFINLITKVRFEKRMFFFMNLKSIILLLRWFMPWGWGLFLYIYRFLKLKSEIVYGVFSGELEMYHIFLIHDIKFMHNCTNCSIKCTFVVLHECINMVILWTDLGMHAAVFSQYKLVVD